MKPLPDVLTIQETADYLQLHVMTVYKLARKHKIPVKRIGGQWRFVRKQLETWLGEGGMK